ncbi:MAG: TIGR01777 family oxidoreductase [Bacteriovoracaceae bacterium]|jgi:uncharacterized protein (TIGR01777 family)|nr:TIGR01777 family oxidoreductase [Bacteriovoracaceae bacterium]
MKKALVTGATGFVGKHLVRYLLENEFNVTILCRDIEKAKAMFCDRVKYLLWEDTKKKFLTQSDRFDLCVNLMGENIFSKRWSKDFKQRIYDSRVLGTKNLISSLEKSGVTVKKLISISAIGVHTEGFLKEVCDIWENEALKKSDSVESVSILRLPIVLGKDGGMIKTIYPIFKLGLGASLGSGKQKMQWIHIDDLIRSILFVYEDINAPQKINLASFDTVNNKEFTKLFARLLGKKTKGFVPSMVLRILQGQVSQVILEDVDIEPKYLIDNKFRFNYPTIKGALKDIVSHI